MRRSALATRSPTSTPTAPEADRAAGPSPAEERLVTEFPFVLPRGYVDSARDGPPRRGDAARHGP